MTPSPTPGQQDEIVERAAKELHSRVYPEEPWEDCPGMHADHRATVRAILALAHLPTPPGRWVPLESAPKDGTQLQLARFATGRWDRPYEDCEGMWETEDAWEDEDSFTHYRAMLEAAPAGGDGWRPIEGAPKDGTHAILNRVEYAWHQALGRSDVVQLEVRDVEAMLNVCWAVSGYDEGRL